MSPPTEIRTLKKRPVVVEALKQIGGCTAALWGIHIWTGQPFRFVLSAALNPAVAMLLNLALRCYVACRKRPDHILELSLLGNALLLFTVAAVLYGMDRQLYHSPHYGHTQPTSLAFGHALIAGGVLIVAAAVVWLLRMATGPRSTVTPSTLPAARRGWRWRVCSRRSGTFKVRRSRTAVVRPVAGRRRVVVRRRRSRLQPTNSTGRLGPHGVTQNPAHVPTAVAADEPCVQWDQAGAPTQDGDRHCKGTMATISRG